jgi:hypothetical protein
MFKSNIFTIQTGLTGKNMPVDYAGRVRIAHGFYTPTGKEVPGSAIGLVRLPKGARVLPISEIHFAAGQDPALTVKVGDAGNPARYFAGAAAGTKAMNANAMGNYLTPGEEVVTLTTGGAAMAAGKEFVFDIYYVVD